MVSMAGVTGSALQDLGPMAQTVERVRASSGLPICVGFGISTPEDAARVARYADGVVVGSALVATVEREGRGAVAKVAEQVSALREALER
jgi:tryptophan synthase alpha chain